MRATAGPGAAHRGCHVDFLHVPARGGADRAAPRRVGTGRREKRLSAGGAPRRLTEKIFSVTVRGTAKVFSFPRLAARRYT